MVSFDFGAKIPMKTKIDNPRLSEEQNTHWGEIQLFLQHCDWRLENAQGVLCDCEDDNLPDGAMLRGLGHLVGQKVEGVKLSLPSFDLKIEFGDDLRLLISCVHDGSLEGCDNYCYFYADEVFGIEANGVLVIENGK
jgi:hypothetical protein